MKYKATKREIMGRYDKIIKIGYCDLSNALDIAGKSPEAYTCGVYGWNADVYDMGNGVAIVTGYNPFGNIKPDYATVIEPFNKKFDAIREDYYKDYNFRRYQRRVKRILNNLCKKLAA